VHIRVRSGCCLISSGDLVVGGGRALGAEPKQGLEGGHWGAAAVMAEDVLVEVDLQVGVADAAVGTGQEPLAGSAIWLRRRWS
jgi:hypothetical protein